MGFLSWHNPQVKPKIGWLLTWVLYHHCNSTSCRQDRLEVEGFMAGVRSRILFGVPSGTKETRTWGWRLHAGNNLTSLCSMSYKQVVLGKGALLIIFRVQASALASAWVVWGSPWESLDKQLCWMEPSHGTESLAWLQEMANSESLSSKSRSPR